MAINSNKILTFAILIIVSFLFKANAQISTVNGFNYYDINKDAFTVNVSCLNLPPQEIEEKSYLFTSLHLAQEVDNLFTDTLVDSTDVVIGDYIIKKRIFFNTNIGADRFRWVLIRPNDTITRPVVLITDGGKTSGSSPMTLTSLGTYDYVQRGYAVVFYQSGRVDASVSDFLRDAGTDSSCYINPPCDWSPDCDIDCFQQAVLFKAQCTQAAAEYAVHYSNDFHLDTTLFFSTAFSGGAFGSLYFAMADGNTFSNALFNNMGNNLSQFSLYPNETFQLKAVTTLAGGILSPTSANFKFNTLIDSPDTSVRFLMFHGQDDFAVQPNTGVLGWTTPENDLEGSQITCALDIREQFKQIGIHSKTIINCSAGHDIYTFPCDYNDDALGNNPLFGAVFALPEPIVNECLDWIDNFYVSYYRNFDFTNICANDTSKWERIFYAMHQIHDYSKISAYYFHKDFSNSGPTKINDPFINNLLLDTGVTTIGPTDFPYNATTNAINGHFINSTKCLTQSCVGLYFNKTGVESPYLQNIGYRGDFVTAPNISGNPFNNDFTLELFIKPLDHTGVGTLFSHTKNDGNRGFEIFINASGNIQFKKNESLGGNQVNIIGTVNVLDNNCHNIVLTRNGNLFGLYVDGVLQDVKKNINYNFPFVPNYKIGNTLKTSATTRGFNGFIKGVRIWNAEISVANFGQQNLPSSTTSLLSDWEFTNGIAQEIISTNLVDTIYLGSNKQDSKDDPRWMKNDEMCTCNNGSTTSVNEKSKTTLNLSIYPNPNNGSFTIENKSEFLEETHIIIYDIYGKTILQRPISTEKTELSIRTKGIYLLKVQEKNNIETFKIIIQ